MTRPRQLGKYELIAKIGAGGMAEVYLARQSGPMNFQKVVVVKLIHPHLSSERQFVDMFLDEARVSALIKHHNVVDIYDLGQDGDVFFIAMEFIPGQALSRVLARTMGGGKRLDVFTTSRIIADAATGLDAAHNLTSITGEPLKLVHRDVSPGNILVSYAGAVKLVDFGVSQSLAQLSTTESSVLKGKIGYSSPEQLNAAPIDHRSDIFSLGVVLWEALALERLFKAESPAATVKKILDGNPTPPSQIRQEVPHELDDIVLRALSLKPEDRFQTAVEMRDELLGFLREANYYGDHRQVAAFMKEIFADKRKEEEALLKAVVEAEEEIQVDLDIDEVLGYGPDPLEPVDAEVDDDLEAEMILEDGDLEAEMILQDDDVDDVDDANNNDDSGKKGKKRPLTERARSTAKVIPVQVDADPERRKQLIIGGAAVAAVVILYIIVRLASG